MHPSKLIALLVSGIASSLAGSNGAAAAPPTAESGPKTRVAAAQGCVPNGNGFLRARIRGALDLDVDLRDAELQCEGSARPDGSGIRLSFAGPQRADGRRLRMVFGIGSVSEGAPGRALPTNLTVIFEGEQRLFATRGDTHCTVDELRQERIGDLAGPRRTYRVVARGFCVGPANAISRDERILVSSFDFAGRATFETELPSRPLEGSRGR